ncbi:MAG TPA: deaminase [Candidatus Saccharimonadales bacterium]|nr:deaminase [Candidatus Saccharimonadales bacterium]
MDEFEYNWSDMAFGSKKPLKDMNAIFIPAPREMSIARVTQLIKQYLPIGNIILGCSTEPYIIGFEGQAQFKTLQSDAFGDIVSKVNGSASPHKIAVLHHSQSDSVHIFEKIKFQKALLVSGSWSNSFHTRPEYYMLVSKKIDFVYISPFVDENEAKKYAEKFTPTDVLIKGKKLSETEMLKAAELTATNSFDNSYQIGVAVGKKTSDKYELVMTSYNPVVPYQTFAWHFGALRERHFTPPGDLNYYDTVHAEIFMLIQAQKKGLDLVGTSLFINVLPCPTCARALCESDIKEVIYSRDHSDGYAVALLESAGKTVRRLIDTKNLIKTEG